MKRPARLQAARHWLATFGGKNVVRGYARWFAVDLECAVKELQLLGVELDAKYIDALRITLRNRRKQHQAPAPIADAIPDGYGIDWDDTFAYIAGFTSGGAPFGVTWEDAEAEGWATKAWPTSTRGT